MLTGLIRPDKGSISYENLPHINSPITRKSLGVAPQALALYDDLTGEENLSFFGSMYDIPRSAVGSRVAEALELVGLTDRKSDRVVGYSGGMKRRLNLACALVHRPSFLLFDEPTAGVDPQSRNLIMEKIISLRNDQATVIYTTHYMEEAERLCDRVAIVDHGKMLDCDTPSALITRHGGGTMVTIELEKIPDPNIKLPAAIDGSTLVFVTNDPFGEVHRLREAGMTMRSVTIDRPNLERVFLNLTGRKLRD
jgi:ABC-2 type transport system ATP-binding protein